MKMDWRKALERVADMPEVKRAVSSMKERGITEHLITLGLARAPSSMLVPALGFFAAGAACGAAAAMLLTPRTGEAFRSDVAELLKNAGSKMNERVTTLRERREERTNGAASA